MLTQEAITQRELQDGGQQDQVRKCRGHFEGKGRVVKEKCWVGGSCEGSTAGTVGLGSGDLEKLCTCVFFSLR